MPPPTSIRRDGGVAPLCQTCGLVGHRTALCVAHLLPNLIVHTTGRRKQRLQEYFLSSPLYAAFHLTAVESQREGQLIFLRTLQASAVLHTAQVDSVINRHFYDIYTVRDSTRHIEKLLLPFRSLSDFRAVRVQGWPKAACAEVLQALTAAGVRTDRRSFSHVLFAVFAYKRYHYALETADHYYPNIHQRLDANINCPTVAAALRLSSAAAIANGDTRSSNTVVCRAYYKLKEVFILEPSLRIDPHMRAVDVGSAPGGWTSFLAGSGCALVLSIDPAELLIPAHPAVLHLQKRAEDCQDELRLHGPFHLLTCDMNSYALSSVSCILSVLLPHLLAGCGLVLTLKELQTGQARRLQADAMDLLSVGFEQLRVRFLLSNGRERTVLGVRRERRNEEEEEEVRQVLDRVESMRRDQKKVVKEKHERRRNGFMKGSKLGRRQERRQAKAELIRQQREGTEGGEGDEDEKAQEEATKRDGTTEPRQEVQSWRSESSTEMINGVI